MRTSHSNVGCAGADDAERIAIEEQAPNKARGFPNIPSGR